MSTLYLLARVAGTAVAILTDEIEAAVRLKDIAPVPGVPAPVAGLSALRSRVLTVIDAAALITGESVARPPLSDAGHYAVVCNVGGHSYGILVDGVDDIVAVDAPPLPLCGRIDKAWEPHARGVIERDGQSRFVLSIAGLLDQCTLPQAA
ncbi:MAG: chemotaxis protein CheW [Sphingobium sp.]